MAEFGAFRASLLPYAAVATVAMLTACDGGASTAAGSAIATESQVPTRASTTFDAKTDLLYVSDNRAGAVYVYTYPGLVLQNTLAGFQAPNGECVDKRGDVFIANLNGQNLVEYRHGGSTPIATFADSGSYPIDCAVDPTTGNLAVTNIGSFGSFEGSVVTYKIATGARTYFTDPDIYDHRYCAYDSDGDLFMDGDVEGPKFRFAELPKGGASFVNISLNRHIKYAGGVQFDGPRVVIADAGDGRRDVPGLYRFEIRGHKGKAVGKTRLDGSDSVFQFWLSNRTVVAPDSGGSQKVRLYRFPLGGAAVDVLSGFAEPAGVTISKARSR